MKAIIAVPALAALVYRAYSHKSLTPMGIVAAALTGIVHAVHPWNMPFVLLAVFFLAGSRVTKVKADVKARLTMASAGTSGGEGPRTHVQVFANSAVATSLIILQIYLLRNPTPTMISSTERCALTVSDLLTIGILANYAAVAADTFSSELGILSKSQPRLITSPTFRKVPPGTNGGVTLYGLAAGVLGSMIVVTAGIFFLPICGQGPLGAQSGWTKPQIATLMLALTAWGALGSVLDSLLGGWLQASVRDVRTNKIVEGEGGIRVLVAPESGAGLLPKDDGKSPLVHGRAKASSEVAGAGIVSKTSRKASFKAAVLSGEGKDAIAKLDSTLGAEGEAGSSTAVTHEAADDDVVKRKRYDAKDKERTTSFAHNQPTRVIESGLDLLDNNDVNLLMAAIMSVGAMAIAKWYFDVPLTLE